MGYIKKTWSSGDLIASSALNNIESGIEIAIAKTDGLAHFDTSIFSIGGVNHSTGAFYPGNTERVSTPNIIKVTDGIYFKSIDNNYQVNVIYLSDNTPSATVLSVIEVKGSSEIISYSIPKNSFCRLTIRLKSETGATADVNTFVNKVVVLDNFHTSFESLKETVNSLTLPNRLTSENVRIEKYVQNIDSDADFRLIVFSDPHSRDINKYKKYNELNISGIFDVLLGLGDYQAYDDDGKALDKWHISNCLKYAGRLPNCLYTIGNHESGLVSYVNRGPLSADYIMTKKETFDCLQRHLDNFVVRDPENIFGGYYYVDFPAQKIRLIILNSSDVWEADNTLLYKYSETVMYHQQQINWFANTALDFTDKGSDKSNWSVLCAVHADFGRTMLSEILNAAKTGSAINKSWTLYQRLTYNSSTHQWDSPIDTVNGDTFSINKDFSSQGAVHVIGVLYGHSHTDRTVTDNTINWLNFCCDNGWINNWYGLDIAGGSFPAGTYYFSGRTGASTTGNFSFTLSESISGCTKIVFNDYNIDSKGVSFIDSNWHKVATVTAVPTASPSGTKLTGFVSLRDPETASTESCAIVNINKTTKTITTRPYGLAEERSVVYEL